jgi:hypothetical protein
MSNIPDIIDITESRVIMNNMDIRGDKNARIRKDVTDF